MPAAVQKREAPAREAATALPARDTHDRFIEEAERLFAENGYNGTSIRAIAQAANASLGTLHQYWRSKRLLFEEIFHSRFGPIHQERLERLQAVQRAVPAGGRPAPRALVEALVEPLLLTYAGSREEARLIRALLGRALTDPAPEVTDTMRGMATETYRLFLELLREACPHLDAREFHSRLNCVVAASMFINIRGERASRQLPGLTEDGNWPLMISQMVHFLTAGLEAAPAGR